MADEFSRPAGSGREHKDLTLADLPAPHERHWGARKKALVVAAVNAGLLTLRQAQERYELSVEEYVSWAMALSRDGAAGLRMQQRRAQAGVPNLVIV
jgi:hypothetical protein